jgi:hypothetical protein
MQMLPVVEILADCLTDAERAEWLLRVPDGIIMRDRLKIKDVLVAAGFHLGDTFLEVRFSILNATRGADGDLPPGLRTMLEKARSTMRAIAFAAPSKGGAQ